MIPVALRIAIVVVGALAFAASFVIRSSVDRGTRITHDRPPSLQTDAAAFTLRFVGAFVVAVGLLTWVVAYSVETHRGIF